jgi:hypothetical protein
VIAQRGPDCFISDRRETGQQFLKRLRREFGSLGQRGGKSGDVCGVVFSMMDFHGLRIDVRLQRVERIGQPRKRGRGKLGGPQTARQKSGPGRKGS